MKKSSNISSPLSSIESLKFSTLNYFGMGSMLTSISESYWINFSAYYLNNILPDQGNQIFLVAQIFEGVGILLGWLILAKFGKKYGDLLESNQQSILKKICKFVFCSGINLYIFLYIIGACMLMTFLPLVFLLPLSTPRTVFAFSILAKIGSGFMIISQTTIIPQITLNRSRRRKLVEKVTQYGLAGTFLAMFIMTLVSIYVNFVWKYFIGVCSFVLFGGICSVMYVFKIREIVNISQAQDKEKQNSKSKKKIQFFECKSSMSEQIQEIQPQGLIQCPLLRSPKFYIYAAILVFGTLYMDISIAVYPYFIKSFNNTTQFKYLSSITILYLSSFVCSIITKNVFVFSSIRAIMSVGLLTCIFSTIFLIISLGEGSFDIFMVIGSCLIGVSKVIATNCVLNMINQFIGHQVKGREFVYGFYYFIEKIIAGFVLYILIKKVYLSQNDDLLNFSQIYLSFILYTLAWVFVMIDQTLLDRLKRKNKILKVEPNKPKMQVKNSLINSSKKGKVEIIKGIENIYINEKIQNL